MAVCSQASQWHEMSSHDPEVMSLNPCLVELGGYREQGVLSQSKSDYKPNLILYKSCLGRGH